MSGPPAVLLLSGPNLDLLGVREPDVYGSETLEDHVSRAKSSADRLGLTLEHRQSAHEGDLVQAVNRAHGTVDAVIVNAGALSHYGWSLHDALAAFPGIVVEVHLSEPKAREPWRHRSVIAPVADGSVAGFGGLGYELAVEAVAALLRERA